MPMMKRGKKERMWIAILEFYSWDIFFAHEYVCVWERERGGGGGVLRSAVQKINVVIGSLLSGYRL